MKLSDITHGIVERPARIILCGVSKIGKSTWAAGAPAPIFLPVRGEEGGDALDVARFPVAEKLSDVMDSLETLATEDHKFETVVIDSTSTLEPLVWEAVCAIGGKDGDAVANIEKVGGGFGKGYVEAVKYWRDLMAALDYLRNEKGMGSILIAHVAVKTFSDPGGDNYDTWEMDINKKALSSLERWSDVILFANCKTYTKIADAGSKVSTSEKSPKIRKGVMRDERVLFTQKRPHHPGGGRGIWGRLPYELELSYEAWDQAVKTATKGE